MFFNLKSEHAPEDLTAFFWLLKNTNKPQEELPESIRKDNRLKCIYEGVRIMKQSSVSQEKYEDYLRDVKDIEAKGRAEGAENKLLENIKSVMKNLNTSLEEALKILSVPQSEYEKYKKLIG